MEYHGVVSKIVELLKTGGYWFETFEHEPVRTSEEAARVRTRYPIRNRRGGRQAYRRGATRRCAAFRKPLWPTGHR